jgi:WXG100 family type VII secretion target
MAGSAQQTTTDVAAMAQAAVYVDNCGQSITTIWNQVNDAVDQTHGGYETAGAALFRNVMGQWSTDFGKIIEGLEEIRQALVGNRLAYHGAIDIDHMSANQVAALLNGGDV